MSVVFGKFEIPELFKTEEATRSATFTRFIAGPFERGYGHTVGNFMRRILLSSLEAPAIISMRIEGVSHEYSSIEGVVEDVTSIVLNLKNARLRKLPMEGECRAYEQWVLDALVKVTEGDLKKSGQVVVTLGDLVQGGQFEVVNSELPLFTITKPFERRFFLRVAIGRGYEPIERLTIVDRVVDEILIDGLFSPVSLTTYKVENTRVGQDTDYDLLLLDVTTDGRVSPQEALSFAAQIGQQHVGVFIGAEQIVFDHGETVGDSEREEMLEMLSQKIGEIELSVRSTNCLNQAGIQTIGELVVRRESEMLQFRNFGKKSLSEIRKWLEKLDLGFGMDLAKYGITRENVRGLIEKHQEQKLEEEANQATK